jgi:hypothetical protein
MAWKRYQSGGTSPTEISVNPRPRIPSNLPMMKVGLVSRVVSMNFWKNNGTPSLPIIHVNVSIFNVPFLQQPTWFFTIRSPTNTLSSLKKPAICPEPYEIVQLSPVQFEQRVQ